jgi:hypothetical protein
MKKFWLNAYRANPYLFWVELVAILFTISGSLVLALNADDPDLSVVYPMFFVGSCLQAWVSYRRQAAWIMVLTIYFIGVNILGFGRSIGMW